MPDETFVQKVEIVRAPNYRAFTADGAVVTRAIDGLGVTLHVTLVCLNAAPDTEEFDAKKEGDLITQVGASRFGGPPIRKFQEATVLMRPDHAFLVARAILENVKGFSEEQRVRYGLPRIELRLA